MKTDLTLFSFLLFLFWNGMLKKRGVGGGVGV